MDNLSLPVLRRDKNARYVGGREDMFRRASEEILGEYLDRRAERFSYDGAQAGRRTSGWYAPGSDANVELIGSLRWLRDRSRDLVRNNRYATKALEELTGNTVGTGIVPQAMTGDDDLNKVIDAEWPYFANSCDTPQRLDFYGMQALVTRSTAESGEGLVRYRNRLAKDNLRIPLQLQVLEADFLDHARTMGNQNGHVMMGVEFDLIGRRTAYWLWSYHPGGVLVLNPRGGIVSQPVPAENVLHVYRVLRPGQVRGVPWLTPSMIALRDLEDYQDAERVRKKIEACVVAMVTQPEGIWGGRMGIPQTDPTTGRKLDGFQPGSVNYLKPGEDVKFNNPPASGGYREYVMTELQGIMAGIGIPYELGTGDMSNVNYSSWRGGMLGFRNTIEGYRWLTVVPMFCQPVRNKFIDMLVLLGKIPSKATTDPDIKLYQTQWTAPRFENVDPEKEARAILLDIRMGRTTWFEAVLSAGYDPRTQMENIDLFNKLCDKFGVILDCDPRKVSAGGQRQVEPDQTEPQSEGEPKSGVGILRKPPKKATQSMSGEDLGMVQELLVAGLEREQRNRSTSITTRTFLK